MLVKATESNFQPASLPSKRKMKNKKEKEIFSPCPLVTLGPQQAQKLCLNGCDVMKNVPCGHKCRAHSKCFKVPTCSYFCCRNQNTK